VFELLRSQHTNRSIDLRGINPDTHISILHTDSSSFIDRHTQTDIYQMRVSEIRGNNLERSILVHLMLSLDMWPLYI